MLDLAVEVTGSDVGAYAAAPTLLLHLRVTETTGARVHAGVMRTQIRIEPQRRGHDDGEAARLVDLFGERDRWAESLRSFVWTEVPTTVGAFEGSTEVDLAVPCSYDLEVAASRYLHSLGGGTVPLLLLFSGTLFVLAHDPPAPLSVSPVPWHVEARYGLPIARWREAIDRWFPAAGWIRFSRSTIDALGEVKAREALPTWEQTVELLLKRAGERT